MWFDAPMDGDEARIEELERGFRRDGLPNLVVDYSAAEDVFTRALPFLALVFAVEVVVAVDAELGWTGIALVAAVLATLVMAFGVMNAVRGQRFFSVPERVDTPELVAFVVLPVLVSFVFGDQRLDALAVLAINLVLVGGTYLVVGFGVLSIVRWAGVRFFTQLRTTLPVLVRAVPLLLFFSLVMFFTTEIWQVFSLSPTALFWTAMALFMALGIVFLSVRLPGVIREVETDADVGEDPLRRSERRNLEAVALISEGLQVLFVSAAVWLFYVVLGSLLVTERSANCGSRRRGAQAGRCRCGASRYRSVRRCCASQPGWPPSPGSTTRWRSSSTPPTAISSSTPSRASSGRRSTSRRVPAPAPPSRRDHARRPIRRNVTSLPPSNRSHGRSRRCARMGMP